MKVKKRKDRTFAILKKAWEIQSAYMRKFKCVGCGSTKSIQAGHLIHGGRGKAWNMVDFNVLLPANNIYSQCACCNTFNPNGNGLLYRHFQRMYFTSGDLYAELQSLKQKVWKPTEEDAMGVLRKTILIYGTEEDMISAKEALKLSEKNSPVKTKSGVEDAIDRIDKQIKRITSKKNSRRFINFLCDNEEIIPDIMAELENAGYLVEMADKMLRITW